MRENEGVLLNQLVKADRAKKTVFLQPPAFQAGCHGLATGALAPRILLCRENQAGGASSLQPHLFGESLTEDSFGEGKLFSL